MKFTDNVLEYTKIAHRYAVVCITHTIDIS